VTGKETVGVVGAGLMGVGIATRMALAGHEVRVHDVDAARLAGLAQGAVAILAELAEAGQFDVAMQAGVLERLRTAQTLQALGGCALVIEAVPERLPLKHDTYRQLEPLLAPDAVLASNTSSFPPDEIASVLARPGRFLIAHFWNPPHAIPLVEIVPGSATDAAVVETTRAWLAAAGATPVVLNRAVPGFIGNRIQFAVLREALALVCSGVASAEVVDTVMRASLGRRWKMVGPLEGADLGGLDTFLDISSHLMPTLARTEDALPLLSQYVAAGSTGARAGRGFYEWTETRRAAVRAKRIAQLAADVGPDADT
jgi:3-hydroxybutyryl-CoA dehydrogenase